MGWTGTRKGRNGSGGGRTASEGKRRQQDDGTWRAARPCPPLDRIRVGAISNPDSSRPEHDRIDVHPLLPPIPPCAFEADPSPPLPSSAGIGPVPLLPSDVPSFPLDFPYG